MQFRIDPAVFDILPQLVVGVLRVQGIDNSKQIPEMADLLRAAEKELRASVTQENVKEHPKIASLQEAHRAFGSNPNKFPPSHQALAKRVAKGGELPCINTLVDLYNIISLRYIVPAGGEDTDQCEGNIRLAIAEGNEEFVELGTSENTPPNAGEIVYMDDKGVICRKLDWREGDRTKLTEQTKNAVLVVEGLPPVTSDEAAEAMQELQSLVQKYCGGESNITLLTKENPDVDL